jgi:dienelactone hydrolase
MHARWHRPARLWTPPPRLRLRGDIPVHQPVDPRHVVIVGVCSSGKSTLKQHLRERGYLARTCAQEHSGVPHLWQRLSPDILIYLDASLPTIRRRGRTRWQQGNLEAERERLAHARTHCDLYVHTDGLSPHDVVSRALTFLNNNR